MTRAQGQRRHLPNCVVGQRQSVQRYAEEMLTDAVRKCQQVGARGIIDNQFARPYDRLAVALSDQTFARQLKSENDTGPHIVTRQLRGSFGGRMIGPHRENGQLPEIGDRADRRRGAAVGGEGELHMDEGLRDRVTNGVRPVARRKSAGIEEHRHCCATHWPPVGSTAICASQRPVHTERSALRPQVTTHFTVCTPIGVLWRVRVIRVEVGRDNGANVYEDDAMRFLVMLVGFALLGVATAQADPGNSGTDASFLEALTKAGITYQDPAVAVAVAKKACALMDQGNPEAGVIKSVSSSNPGFTGDGAAQFTMIAASAYCPQHMGRPVTQAPPTPLLPQQ